MGMVTDHRGGNGKFSVPVKPVGLLSGKFHPVILGLRVLRYRDAVMRPV